MLKIVPSNQFKKDLKLAKKRGCKIELLREVVNTLAQEKSWISGERIIHKWLCGKA